MYSEPCYSNIASKDFLESIALCIEEEQKPFSMKTENKQNRFFMEVLQCLPIGVIVLDGRGLVVFSNPFAIQLVGEPLLGERWIEIITRSFSPRADDGHEISLKDGRRIHIATNSIPSKTHQVLVLTDLTQTRALQEQRSFEERLIAMGKMAASLAHQLRTPLSTALLYADNLQTILTTEKENHYVLKLSHQLRYLEHQISNMLMFAKGGKTVMENIALSCLLEQFIEISEIPLREANAVLVVDDKTKNVTVRCNPNQVVGALQNLLTNAIEATKTSISLKLTLKIIDKKYLSISLKDNGPGLTNDEKTKIFLPFYTTKSKGTGLGLAVVQATMKTHGGDIWIESNKENGTEIGLLFPINTHSDVE